LVVSFRPDAPAQGQPSGPKGVGQAVDDELTD